MNYRIKELRLRTGLTQKEFAEAFGIPVSTLRKWEQGEATPPDYVAALIAERLPFTKQGLQKYQGKTRDYYYDETAKIVYDTTGNGIRVDEDLHTVNPGNLQLYLDELFDAFYEIRRRFRSDCAYDRTEGILWSRES